MFGLAPLAGAPIAALGGDRATIALPAAYTATFTAILTGAADALPDLPLPMSYLTVRLRPGVADSVASLTIPGADLYSGVASRPNGQVKITFTYTDQDGFSNSFLWFTGAVTDTRTDEGSQSDTLSIEATTQLGTNENKLARSLGGAEYRAFYSSARRFRAAFDPVLLPDDTAVVGAESFIVGGITASVSPDAIQFEVSE